MLFRVILISILALLLPSIPAEGRKRTSATVKKERREAGKKIERTKGQIKTNLADTRRQLAEFQTIEAEIGKSDASIRVLQARTDSVSRRVTVLADSVTATEARVTSLKAGYAASLRAIRRQRQSASATAFIVASESFTEARKRMRYLAELGKSEKEKAANLSAAAALLKQQKATLDSVRTILAADLASLKAHKRKLEKDRATADALVAKLKRNGRRLEQVLGEQQERARKLDRELDRIIEEEARAAAEAERKRKAAEEAARKEEARRKAAQDSAAKKSSAQGQGNAAPKPAKPEKKQSKQAPQRKKVTAPAASTFAAAKGKLPMPVSGPAMIVGDFGRHRHKDFEKVEMMNNGIDIETTEGASAVAVYPGTVTMVIVMDGYHNVVLVRHGEYLTVYAGIASLAVRKGQEVTAGQSLGTIYSDPLDSGRTRLHFEVRHEKEKLNPSEWLR